MKKKYTLDEARALVNKERCQQRRYHNWLIHSKQHSIDDVELVVCSDCDLAFTTTRRDDDD